MGDSSDDGDLDTVDELFSLLGNDLRMRIMQVLWEDFEFEYYAAGRLSPISFSRIFDRSGVVDSGNFNYHLGKLSGTLVEQYDDGYHLSPLGYNLMRAIEQFGTFEYDTTSETELEEPCPFCGGSMVGAYERQLVQVRCRDCGGLAEDGNLTFVQLPATGVQHHDLETMLDVAILELESRVRASKHGVCWQCHDATERTFTECDDHRLDATGICVNCNSRFNSDVHVDCSNCGTSGAGPLFEYALVTPEVRSGLRSVKPELSAFGPWKFRLAAFEGLSETIRSAEPLTVEYEFRFEDKLADEVVRAVVETEDGLDVNVENNLG